MTNMRNLGIVIVLLAALFIGWRDAVGEQEQLSEVVIASSTEVVPTATVTPTQKPVVSTETPEPLETVQLVFRGTREPGSIENGPSNGEIPYLFEVLGVDFESLTQEERIGSVFPPMVNEKGDSRYGWGGTNEQNVFAVYMPQSARADEYVVSIVLPDSREASVKFEHVIVEVVSEEVVNTPTPTPAPKPTVASTQTPVPQPTAAPTQAAGHVGPPNSGPPNTAARNDPLLGPLPAGSSLPVVCGGGTFVIRELRVPPLLTDEEQEVFISITYLVPIGAVDARFIGTPSILVFDSSQQDVQVTGADVLAVFPNAGNISPSDNVGLAGISFSLPEGATSLVVDGKPHTISWTFILPTEEAYDTSASHNGIDRLSAIWKSPFQLDYWMFVMLAYTVDGVRYQNSHGCF